MAIYKWREANGIDIWYRIWRIYPTQPRCFKMTEKVSFNISSVASYIYIFGTLTMFENHPKFRIWVFQFWHFPSIFVLLKVTCLAEHWCFWKIRSMLCCLVTLFDCKIDYFDNLQWSFVHSNCKRSSIPSQCWLRLFMWFSNTVVRVGSIQKIFNLDTNFKTSCWTPNGGVSCQKSKLTSPE